MQYLILCIWYIIIQYKLAKQSARSMVESVWSSSSKKGRDASKNMKIPTFHFIIHHFPLITKGQNPWFFRSQKNVKFVPKCMLVHAKANSFPNGQNLFCGFFIAIYRKKITKIVGTGNQVWDWFSHVAPCVLYMSKQLRRFCWIISPFLGGWSSMPSSHVHPDLMWPWHILLSWLCLKGYQCPISAAIRCALAQVSVPGTGCQRSIQDVLDGNSRYWFYKENELQIWI